MVISNACNNDHFEMCTHAYRAHEWLPLNLKDCKPLNHHNTNEFAGHEDHLQKLDERCRQTHHSNHEVLYHMIDDFVVPIINIL